MPKYLVRVQSFIGNHLRQVGDVIEYDGEASSNLQLVPEETEITEPHAPSISNIVGGRN